VSASVGSGLNESHRRAISAAFRHIDGLLADVEAASSRVQSPFSRFFGDLSPTQQDVVADYVAQIRARMMEVLTALGISLRPPESPASWAIQTNLSFARITVQEIDPSRLTGYGAVGPEAGSFVARANADLERILQRLLAYVAQGLGKDLSGRLQRLERVPVDVTLLKNLERIIREHGLIEFHATLEGLLERLETKTFEIAVFGRVSSGKSSLLNVVLGFQALPVGITPITAVPTRVIWGETPKAEIRFAEAPDLQISLERLSEFVSETGNPENRKRVVRAVVTIPSPELREGIVFVDTPGVGSLAKAAARESYAYLPRCDLGILLIDAASAPTREDLDLLRILYESGIPGIVVVSKVDLLSGADRERMRGYVREQIASHLALDPPVHLVSTAEGARLARSWFSSEIRPLLARSVEMAEASARRKLASMREGVAASLRAMLAGRSASREHITGLGEKIEKLALEAEATLQEAMRKAERLADQARTLAEPTFTVAAAEISRRAVSGQPYSSREILRQAVDDTASAVRRQVQEAFVAARDRLRGLLQEMAAELDSEPSRAEELALDLVTLPSLSLPPEIDRLELPVARWARRFPKFLEKGVHGRLSALLSKPIDTAYQSFSRDLRAWIFSAERELGNRFGAQSEPFRAQARRQREGVGRAGPEKIAADLRLLDTAAVPAVAAPAGEDRGRGDSL
jgi:GTP-binding protein EngB required for normal cell division